VPAHDTHENDASERLALVVHELRAPLTVVRGYLQLLERDRPGADIDRARAAAGRAVERLEILLDDLMAAISKSEVFAPAVRRHIALRQLAEEVADDVSPLYSNRISVEGGLGELQGDPTRLRQAIENLVSNAVKHAHGEGPIVIDVEDMDASGIVRLSVQDFGPGIPAEDRERVFNLFERLAAKGAAPHGLGLGLPIARAIVTGHGGRVFLADSPAGTGARFVMELPASPGTE